MVVDWNELEGKELRKALIDMQCLEGSIKARTRALYDLMSDRDIRKKALALSPHAHVPSVVVAPIRVEHKLTLNRKQRRALNVSSGVVMDIPPLPNVKPMSASVNSAEGALLNLTCVSRVMIMSVDCIAVVTTNERKCRRILDGIGYNGKVIF